MDVVAAARAAGSGRGILCRRTVPSLATALLLAPGAAAAPGAGAPPTPAGVPPAAWIAGGILLIAVALLLRRRFDTAPTSSDELERRVRERTRELELAYSRLRTLDEQKDAFLSAVSHEFRTPLASIRSFSEILLSYDNVDSATIREFITIIHEESERLSRLVDDLLDLTKIESGRAKWRMTEVRIEELVETVVRNALSLAGSRDVHLNVRCDEGLPPVRADRDRLIQVFTNLLSNAIKFSPGGAAIDVVCRREGDHVRVDVEDRGPGVPEEERERIFEKFHQVRANDGEGPRGTGLGLPISREIVQRLGGELWVEPRPGGGSRFSFVLPTPIPSSTPASS